MPRTGFDEILCGRCSIAYWVPDFWVDDKRRTGATFYCPNGHPAAWEETEADKLRRERDLLKQRVAQRDDEVRRQRDLREHAERQTSAFKGQVTKLRNRAKAGVCPCCNRQFQNLRRHMTSKHPDFQPDAPELKVIEGGSAD